MKLCRASVSSLLVICLFGCGESHTSVSPASTDNRASDVDRRDELQTIVGPAVNVEVLARNYAELTLITAEPVLVDPQLASLCVGIRPQFVDDAQKENGPHAHTSVRIFMNEIATGAFRDAAAKYPVGSVIVKEKQGLGYDLVNDDGELKRNAAKTASGVGGMIKRPAGYDPDHGDWEYFYFEEPAKVEQGRIASCVECHRGAAATDYVFGGWAGEW
jgi:hypothetical protein